MRSAGDTESTELLSSRGGTWHGAQVATQSSVSVRFARSRLTTPARPSASARPYRPALFLLSPVMTPWKNAICALFAGIRKAWCATRLIM